MMIQSPKLKRVSLDETPEFPFWGLNIHVDFDLRDSNWKFKETVKNNITLQKYCYSQKCLTPFVKPGF